MRRTALLSGAIMVVLACGGTTVPGGGGGGNAGADGGAGAGGGGDLDAQADSPKDEGGGTTFACGPNLQCTTASNFCWDEGFGGADYYYCPALPPGCHSCSCLQSRLSQCFTGCDDSGGEITAWCYQP